MLSKLGPGRQNWRCRRCQGSEPSINHFDGGLSNRDRDESSDDGVVWGQGADTVDYLHLLV